MSKSLSFSASSSASSSSSGTLRLPVTMRGLHAMPAASRATVLYAPPADGEGLLRGFCDRLRASFLSSGLMVKEDRPLLLHATVVNTIYSKAGPKGGRGGRGRNRPRLVMDARELLRRYDDHIWAEDLTVTKIALCRMGAKAVEGSDGDQAYEVEAETEM
ncbi:hypothetical protein RJ55_02446 [Drechmeria coniospora]|nr:hypothetical protein RJ55_02446 [Drechmeria coniospora]